MVNLDVKIMVSNWACLAVLLIATTVMVLTGLVGSLNRCNRRLLAA
jgi:hypothetical protein